MATLPASAAHGTPVRRLRPHHYLWILLGLMGLSVLAYTDYPTFFGSDPLHARARFLKELLILIPHAVSGITATALGPFLFSTRFRQRHLLRHRVMGRVYVICIALAAPTAYLLEPNIANGVGGYCGPHARLLHTRPRAIDRYRLTDNGWCALTCSR